MILSVRFFKPFANTFFSFLNSFFRYLFFLLIYSRLRTIFLPNRRICCRVIYQGGHFNRHCLRRLRRRWIVYKTTLPQLKLPQTKLLYMKSAEQGSISRWNSLYSLWVNLSSLYFFKDFYVSYLPTHLCLFPRVFICLFA